MMIKIDKELINLQQNCLDTYISMIQILHFVYFYTNIANIFYRSFCTAFKLCNLASNIL